MIKKELRLTISNKNLVISDFARIFKTERVIRNAKKFNFTDDFLLKLGEAVILNFDDIYDESLSLGYMFRNDRFSVFFRFGKSVTNDMVGEKDVIFYKFVCTDKAVKNNDSSLLEYLSSDSFSVKLTEIRENVPESDFLKVYAVGGGKSVDFPLLNAKQKTIVETENRNMLVQGVAGSGKTNVCIDKIIFCACRNYYGKTLYTTYSRGLLVDTKNRVEAFRNRISTFVDSLESDNVVFVGKDKQKATENYLGINLDVAEEKQIAAKIKQIDRYLREKVDYKLIEDFDPSRPKIADERFFINSFFEGDAQARSRGPLEKVKHIAPELIYKEIYGMIFGYAGQNVISKTEYIAMRKGSFSETECDAIYSLAVDYRKFMERNGYEDNNTVSRKMLSTYDGEKYSLAVIDEVQDFTQINLVFIRSLAMKMFCVGDALQMINPSYFSFAYLKGLMYDKEYTLVSELKHNYRNSQAIAEIIDLLGDLNKTIFGTHNFVLKGESVKNDLPTETVYVNEKGFLEKVAAEKPGDLTVIVSNIKVKEYVRKLLPAVETLTVSEIKGLERNTVLLYNVLSTDFDKWERLKRIRVNRKTADENSVFRYYFNLFYVAVSRAKQNLFVLESKLPDCFDETINNGFSKKNGDKALALLIEAAGKVAVTDEELLKRVDEFVSLGQYDNARFTAERLGDAFLVKRELVKIYVAETFLRYGKYREAGVEYWKNGFTREARKMFVMSGDEKLIYLLDACEGKQDALDAEIVGFYPYVADNPTAKNVILGVLREESEKISATQKSVYSKITGRNGRITLHRKK